MRTLARGVITTLVVASVLVIGPRAEAACHSFTAIAPNTVTEGNKVPVKIERDAAVNPSSVRVTTVSATAESPSDFTGVNQRVEFTNETSRTITIQTTEDTSPESSENFSIRLSDGQGCAVNPDFEYGTPEKVTISDDDQAIATTAPPRTAQPPTTAPPAVTAPAGATPSPSGSPSPSASGSPTSTPSPTLTPLALPIEESDDDFPWLPVGLGAAIVAAGAGALIYTRMRRGGIA